MLNDADVAAIDVPLKGPRDAAFLKLGRNIALFQQLESGLKALYTSLVMEGSDEANAEAMREKRSAVLASRSLGLAIKAVFDELMGAGDSDDDVASEATGKLPYFRFRFGFTGPIVEAQKASLAGLVDERNRLVHHLTDDYDLRSTEGIARLDAMLDPQAQRIRHEINAVREIFDSQLEARRAASEFIGSKEFQDQIELAFLQGSALILGMAAMTLELRRSDGWTHLQRAAQELRRRDPSAFTDLKARYGHSRLKPLLLGSRVFQLRDEPTDNGGSRLLYRVIAPG